MWLRHGLDVFDDARLKSTVAVLKKVDVFARQESVHTLGNPAQEPIPDGCYTPWALCEQQP